MMNVSKVLRRKTAWAVAVYIQDRLEFPPVGRPAVLLPSKKLLRTPWDIHTRADPFLVLENDKLFLFYEAQAADEPGEIVAAEITHSGCVPLGTVLKEPFHLSYPAVIRRHGAMYLLPECQGSGEMRLYEFSEFPMKAAYCRTLLQGQYADPTPVEHQGTLFIFATTHRGLELFFMDDIRKGELVPHPSNPITNDPRWRRCGGAPFIMNGDLVRPAQNCSRAYGENLSLMKIEVMTKDAYQETLRDQDVFGRTDNWNSEGSHHVSVVSLHKGVAVAIDGQTYDHYIHKFLTRGWMLATGTRGGAPGTGSKPS